MEVRDLRPILLGSAVGVLGAGGQLILFEALRNGPAYLVFPIVSLYPVVTVLLSLWLLQERAPLRAWAGIGLSCRPWCCYPGSPLPVR